MLRFRIESPNYKRTLASMRSLFSQSCDRLTPSIQPLTQTRLRL
ncbi:MAG: hypothetical protein RIE73_06475 [Coleofasciculus sp. C1-SOL-03]